MNGFMVVIRVVIRAIVALVSLSLGNLLFAQEMDAACKQRFIECVQKTGNPMECHAVSAACIGGVVVDQSEAVVEETIRLSQKDGEIYAHMTVKNVSNADTQVGVRSWGFTCADGSREVLYFMFGDTVVLPGASLVAGGGIACFGKGSATADGEALATRVPMSVASTVFHCDEEKTKKVEVSVQGERLVQFKRSDGFWGTHRLMKADGSDLVRVACEYDEEQQISNWKNLKDESENVTSFMEDMIGLLGISAAEFESQQSTTGVRN